MSDGPEKIDQCEAWAKATIAAQKLVVDGLYSGEGGVPYPIARVFYFARSLFALSPLHQGDTAVLNETLEIEPTSGWYYHRHLLVKGAVATVAELDYWDGAFTVLVWFAADPHKAHFQIRADRFARVASGATP